ncbi:hypothetical protein [Metapseudomonas boanensis]|uniref:Uncharacterized protein n=1 Tax=Metapseudomonas boanensis TaxID=2822138 RepID=A0ABS5XF44_9GAMM|nr:hypothetical protein [Pseudomonas boanensis]MBT8766301.1 hypothetical protein [Pseudomonas boanensis]
MSDQTREKEKSLAELMVRILKEPLKPLGESVQGLEGELSDIKAELELFSGTVADGLKKSDDAAKRRNNEALEALHTLRDEQAEWVPTLRASLAEHAQAGAQALDARLSESLTALAQSERRVLDALASVGEAQRSAAHVLAALSAQFSDNRAALDNALVHWETEVVTANAAVASGLKAAVAEIGQRLEHQHKAAQAVHQALLNGMKGAAEHTQAVMAENLQAGHALRDSLVSGQAGIISALNQHAEALNARLDQSQAKLRRLTITTGVFFVSMLTYVGYELLSRFT